MTLRREEPWEQGEREAEEMRREQLKIRRERFLDCPGELPCCRTLGCDHPVMHRDAMCIACQVKFEREQKHERQRTVR